MNEFNLKDGLKNYIVAKIFDAPSNEKKKRNGRKKKIQYAILSLFAALFQNLKKNIYIYILKHLQKTIPSLKFNMNANTYEKS